MSITKKYKKKKNYRRKTQSLLKKKNRKTRKKMIGGSIRKKYKKKKNYRRKTQSLLKKNSKTRKKMIGGAGGGGGDGAVKLMDDVISVDGITYSELFNDQNPELIISVKQKAQGVLSGGMVKNTNHNYTYLLLKDYKGLGPTIVCLKMPFETILINKRTSHFVCKANDDCKKKIHIEPLFAMRESDVIKKGGMLILNLPDWKVVELKDIKIKNKEGGTLLEDGNKALDTFCDKIYKFMNPHTGFVIKDLIKIYKNKDLENVSADFTLVTNLAIAASVVAGVGSIINTLGDSTKFPFVGMITGGISLLTAGIASKVQEAHEEQKEINELFKEIKSRIDQLWTYIIEPLNKINQLEKSLEDKVDNNLSLARATVSHDNKMASTVIPMESATNAVERITDSELKANVKQVLSTPDINATSSYNSINTNQENILKLILDLLFTKHKYITRMKNLKQKWFSIRHKISLNRHTKERIEYLSSALEKELLLLIQIINIKTNYNTLILMDKTEVQEALVREKKAVEEELAAQQKAAEAQKKAVETTGKKGEKEATNNPIKEFQSWRLSPSPPPPPLPSQQQQLNQ